MNRTLEILIEIPLVIIGACIALPFMILYLALCGVIMLAGVIQMEWRSRTGNRL